MTAAHQNKRRMGSLNKFEILEETTKTRTLNSNIKPKIKNKNKFLITIKSEIIKSIKKITDQLNRVPASNSRLMNLKGHSIRL